MVRESTPIYAISNESYRYTTRKRLRSIGGFDKYIGLCGGGDQNIAILAFLLPNNIMKDIMLIDKQDIALANFMRIADIYNNSGGSYDYDYKLREMARGFRSMSLVYRNSLIRKPKLRTPISITLLRADIDVFIKSVHDPAVYFIYASNALFGKGHCDGEKSVGILNSIITNSSIRDGSVVMGLGNVGKRNAIFLRKEGTEYTVVGRDIHLKSNDFASGIPKKNFGSAFLDAVDKALPSTHARLRRLLLGFNI
jgi:hypothetical protein